MADARQNPRIADDKMPKALQRLVLGLIFSVLVIVTFARVTDRPPEAQPAKGPILAERVIVLEGTLSGAARISSVDGEVLAQYAAGKGGFVSTIERVVARERQRFGVESTGPLHLRKREGGQLALFDPLTDTEIVLASFGADNIKKFAVLLD